MENKDIDSTIQTSMPANDQSHQRQQNERAFGQYLLVQVAFSKKTLFAKQVYM